MQDITNMTRDQALLWTAMLALATVAGSPLAACVLPFAAAAAVAAMTLDLKRAMAAVITIWIGNQAIGFGVLDYPTTQGSFGWGFALLGATVASMLAARMLYTRFAQSDAAASTQIAVYVAAFVASFVTYEGLLFVLANFVGGLDTFTPAVVGQIALNDSIWFVLLMGLRWVLVNAAPAAFGHKATMPALQG